MNKKLHLKKKLITFCLTFFLATQVFAQTFETGDIKYNITDATAKTVEVVKKSTQYSSTHIVIPATVINDGINYSVTSIGIEAFSSCQMLWSLELPSSIISIKEKAFYGCTNVSSFTIPNSITSIEDFAFGRCFTLTSMSIPNSVKDIGVGIFYECKKLTSVSIPNSITEIPRMAFEKCEKLTSITIPNTITSIGNYAFSNCKSLTSVTIPNSVTSINFEAFSGCDNLTSINISNSLTSIGSKVFLFCSKLTSIIIPSSVTSIGESAFFQCNSLDSVICKIATPLAINNDMFFNISSTCTLWVPSASLDAYKAANVWKNFDPIIAMVNVSNVTLNKIELALNVGTEETLIATIQPENATDKYVTWSSNDNTIASVDNTGKITAIKTGTTTINVTTNDGGHTASCEISVIQSVNSVALNKTELALNVGDEETLTATIQPENATDKYVTWSSSDNSIASVDNTGKVTAIKVGTTTINVTTIDGGHTASCEISVSIANGFENLEEMGISIYPNPVNDILNIICNNREIQNIMIIDILGKTVFEKTNISQTESIDMSGISSGIYIINITRNGKSVTHRIIKR